MAKKSATTKKTTTKAAGDKPLTKSQIFTTLSEKTDLSKKDIANVFTEMEALIKQQLGRRGPGAFTVPNLMKVVVQKKPATKAREGINPATGEKIKIAAKPARKVVKVRPLKNLKEMASG